MFLKVMFTLSPELTMPLFQRLSWKHSHGDTEKDSERGDDRCVCIWSCAWSIENVWTQNSSSPQWPWALALSPSGVSNLCSCYRDQTNCPTEKCSRSNNCAPRVTGEVVLVWVHCEDHHDITKQMCSEMQHFSSALKTWKGTKWMLKSIDPKDVPFPLIWETYLPESNSLNKE